MARFIPCPIPRVGASSASLAPIWTRSTVSGSMPSRVRWKICERPPRAASSLATADLFGWTLAGKDGAYEIRQRAGLALAVMEHVTDLGQGRQTFGKHVTGLRRCQKVQ